MSKIKNGFWRIFKQKTIDDQPTGDDYAVPGAKKWIWNQPPRRPWVVVLDLFILYVLLFPFLNAIVGPVSAALVSIPVAAAGWYFGVRTGLIAGLSGVLISSFFLYVYADFGWHELIDGSPGFVLVIVVAYIAGYLHDETFARKRVDDQIASRERFIALINIATRNIISTKNPEDASYRLVSHLTNLFVADYAYLIRWDETRKQATLVAATKPLDQPFSPVLLEPDEASIVIAVLQSERPKVIEDVQSSTYVVNPSPFRELSLRTKSALVMPLITKDYCFGTAILAFDSPHSFTPEEVVYIELAGSQIALALRSVQQQLKLEAQFKEAEALAGIERALSESERVGVDEVLQLIVDSAKDLIPKAKNVILHLLDNEQQLLVPRAVAGYREKNKGRLNMRLGEGAAGMVMETGKVITISDVHADPRFLNQTIPVKFRSLVVAPIRSKEQSIGTISIQSDSPNAFNEGEIALLEQLGTQVAIGIDNANLLEATRQNLLEIDILYRISQSLSGSLDPEQLMKEVADLLRQNFGYYHVMVFVVDQESGDLVARQGSGKIATRLIEQGYRLPVGEGIVGHVANTGEPFVTNDVENVVFYAYHPLLEAIKSELSVPIIIDGQVIGVLDVQQTSTASLTEQQLNLLIAVADQLAVALQKANLYNNLQTSLALEKTMRTQLIQNERLAVAGQLLASVSHEMNNPLQAIQNALFLLKQEEDFSTQGKQDLEIILSEVERMGTLLNRLRATYRPIHSEDIEEIQINNIVEDTYALTSTHMRHNDIIFEFHPDPQLPTIRGVADQIRQVMLNLFINAIESMQTNGHLTVITQQSPDEDQVLLSIVDTGTGIDPEILPKIFEPFFTSKKTGTGLGLSITSDIVQQHGGEIQVENNEQGGATFTVRFPANRIG
jgi:signal transduction histidine kinase